jgi:hypothetical protein
MLQNHLYFSLKVELNEIESRCEEYPLTRAFCQLISTLVETSCPSNLGVGLRPPGFDPYLQFLRDSVFLRFRTRAYRRAAEKVMFRENLFSSYSFIVCFLFCSRCKGLYVDFSFWKLVKISLNSELSLAWLLKINLGIEIKAVTF